MKRIKYFGILLLIIVACNTTNNKSDTEQGKVVESSTEVVYITNTGEKYHKGSCRYLSNSKIEIDLDEAIDKGYEACKVCKP